MSRQRVISYFIVLLIGILIGLLFTNKGIKTIELPPVVITDTFSLKEVDTLYIDRVKTKTEIVEQIKEITKTNYQLDTEYIKTPVLCDTSQKIPYYIKTYKKDTTYSIGTLHATITTSGDLLKTEFNFQAKPIETKIVTQKFPFNIGARVGVLNIGKGVDIAVGSSFQYKHWTVDYLRTLGTNSHNVIIGYNTTF